MGTLLQSTLNTRALPTGNLHYIRSDYPGKLTDQEVKWLHQNDITTVVDLREEKEYIAKEFLHELLEAMYEELLSCIC